MIEHLRHQLHILSLRIQLSWEQYRARSCNDLCCQQRKWGVQSDDLDCEAQCHMRRVRAIMRELRK